MWDHILTQRPEGLVARIVEHDGRIAGFGLAAASYYDPETTDLPRETQLFALYLEVGLQGLDAGQELLDAVLGDAPAMLWVAKENPRAIAFYCLNGFEFDGVEQADPAAPLTTDTRMLR
ncbi:hypothetical protein GCM10027591_06000 [Zhihengliuella somnathii]